MHNLQKVSRTLPGCSLLCQLIESLKANHFKIQAATSWGHLPRTQEKMYVALYTCLTTRAVHLEVVENLTTGAFLNSLYASYPEELFLKLIRTDCGTNIKHRQQIISTMFESDEATGTSLMSYCASENIKWLFNSSASPWMGAVWERLVVSVKKALNKSIGHRKTKLH